VIVYYLYRVTRKGYGTLINRRLILLDRHCWSESCTDRHYLSMRRRRYSFRPRLAVLQRVQGDARRPHIPIMFWWIANKYSNRLRVINLTTYWLLYPLLKTKLWSL